jgi:hypothetical protein
MRTPFGIALAFTFAAAVAGCASVPSTTPSAVVTPMRKKVVERTDFAPTIGKSTKAEVLAALGETLVISFDSGYEVWVYRLRAPAAEFVILFAPSGVVARTRVRAAPATG